MAVKLNTNASVHKIVCVKFQHQAKKKLLPRAP